MKKKKIEDENEIPYDDEPMYTDGVCLLVYFSGQEYDDIMLAARDKNISAERFIKDATLNNLWEIIPELGYDEVENEDGSSVWLPPER